jgi:colanic acid/amylovoran/stewartan biosynthesis glycosyltransferase WcaL/AmsK/CpsK
VRIAAIVGGFPKLSETFILRQLTGLVDLGHEVDIYSRVDPQEGAVQPDVLRYGFLARTYYFSLPRGRAARFASALKAFLSGFPRHPVAMLRCLNVARYRTAYAILNNVMLLVPFLGRRYDVIYCFWGGNGMDFIILKDVFPHVRFVNRFGGDDYDLGDEWGPDALAPLRDGADAFIVQTDSYGRATLLRYGFPDAKIVTYRHVIALREIPFRERHFDGKRLRIVTVARLVEKKGLEHGIRAVAELRARNPQLRLEYRIIGGGPLLARLTETINRLEMGDSVELLGPRTSPEVMRWIAESDVFLLPSVMEQAGYVLLEAQASGLPVVATRVGGVPEMVREGRSALLVPAADTVALAAALQQLVDQPERWPLMGREGRAHVEEHHDADRLAPRLAEILGGGR